MGKIFEHFVLQEYQLKKWIPVTYREFVLYDGPSLDSYDYFCCEFSIILYKWLKRLIESLEQKYQHKQIVHGTNTNLVVFHRLDHHLMQVVDYEKRTVLRNI